MRFALLYYLCPFSSTGFAGSKSQRLLGGDAPLDDFRHSGYISFSRKIKM